MPTWIRIYFDLLYNLFLFAFLYIFVKQTLSIIPNRAGVIPCIIMVVILAILPPLPYNTILSLVIDSLSILFLCFPIRVKTFF